jgi:hypothetical protein
MFKNFYPAALDALWTYFDVVKADQTTEIGYVAFQKHCLHISAVCLP